MSVKTMRKYALALTAYASREDRLNALRAGFQVHMPKPVDIGELLLTVQNAEPQLANAADGSAMTHAETAKKRKGFIFVLSCRTGLRQTPGH